MEIVGTCITCLPASQSLLIAASFAIAALFIAIYRAA
jgi:hypothetical protein